MILFESKIKSLSAVFIMNSKIFLAGSLVIYFGGLYTNFPVITIGCFIVGVCDCLGFTLAISIAGRWL